MSEADAFKYAYRIEQVLALRREIRDGLIVDYLDKVCEGEAFDIFVDDVASYLPKTVLREVLYDSVYDLAGERLTRLRLDTLGWRLAGNLPRLTNRLPAPPWAVQPFYEWVPAQIIQARRSKVGRRTMGWTFTFQILAGTPCPRRIDKFWPGKYCYILAKLMGFNMRRPGDRSDRLWERAYRHAREFVTLRANILIEPELSVSEPMFSKIEVTASQLEWNREQLKFRDRFHKGYECPFKLPRSVYCHQCPVGFKRCRVGTHMRDYAFQYCPACGRDNAAFDLDLATDICLRCYEVSAHGDQI